MVIGFDKFREAFREFAENYIVIGGSACDWLFASQNVEGTKVDLADPLRDELGEFLAAYEKFPLDPRTIGVPGTFAEALAKIREVFDVKCAK